MEELLKYLLTEISGSNDFTIEKEESDEDIIFNVKVKSELMGLIIGKGGNTIKAIQTILRIKARKEGSRVTVNVSEDGK